MIFKHLFTPKWKHPKLSVRLVAIDKLDISDEKDAKILDDLAFNDDAIEIRKEALNKLNDITLWWQAYKKDQAQGIKDIAEQHVSKAILKDDASLSSKIKTEYIDTCTKTSLLEKLALEDKNNSLRVKLLKRLAKPNLIETAFKQGDESFQLTLVELVEQYKLLKSCQNKAHGAAKSKIEQCLEQLKLAKEMPLLVEKESKLILAKLNALREKSDYELVKNQFALLNENWQALELKWLNEEQLSIASEKYLALVSKVEVTLAKLEQINIDKLAQIALKEQAEAKLSYFNTLIHDIEGKLKLSLLSPNEETTAQLTRLLTQSQEELIACEPKLKEQASIQRQFDSFSAQINRLPELLLNVEAFSEHVSEFETLVIPEDLLTYDDAVIAFEQWQKQAKSLLNQMPAPVKQTNIDILNTLITQWKSKSFELKSNLESAKKQSQKKLRDLKRLLDQGRYNIAFGVFKGMNELYQTLTPGYQKSLQSDYELIEIALKKAQDWQQYIAEPKRDELLNELKSLIAEDCKEPKSRAAQVKLFRKRWNELGRINSDEAKLKANEFDLLLEEAFIPCRTFFAEQEAQRKVHLADREQIIEKMTSLNTLESDSIAQFKLLETEYNKLTKAWRQAGSVDTQAYQALLTRYKNAEKVIITKIKAKHKMHAQSKTALLEQAKVFAASEDASQACEQLKQLQEQWKLIGFAGNKAENELWQAFRKCNDDVFSKRETAKKLQESEINVQVSAMEAELNEFQQAFLAVKDSSEKVKYSVLLKQVNEFSLLIPHGMKGLKSKVNELIDSIKDKIKHSERLNKLAKHVELFDVLSQDFCLPKTWHKVIKNKSLSRAQLTVRMEILAQVETPKSDAKLKMDEQIAMLSEKMLGDNNQLNDLFMQWLNVTEFTAKDTDFIKRVRPIFTQ
ncbi:DUF349 domain-containing protein [Pseudoalteromonas denitrificans]|uniref:DUF349 domain-containing protein n=1 Tax=Pseudoalteromonas denitrificans DSM 6059 TaxID=1123010 RepID=A0A1I1P0C8_9GAMM|nr:DUF349 domain-containing protein [Pseudoalteromonas denitrificans]SFD01168.1 protein of unknown function [Pseudoalteromonas denitrificans DSM 6059]